MQPGSGKAEQGQRRAPDATPANLFAGGNSGIGQAIVLELARLHAHVVIDLVDRRQSRCEVRLPDLQVAGDGASASAAVAQRAPGLNQIGAA